MKKLNSIDTAMQQLSTTGLVSDDVLEEINSDLLAQGYAGFEEQPKPWQLIIAQKLLGGRADD